MYFIKSINGQLVEQCIRSFDYGKDVNEKTFLFFFLIFGI